MGPTPQTPQTDEMFRHPPGRTAQDDPPADSPLIVDATQDLAGRAEIG